MEYDIMNIMNSNTSWAKHSEKIPGRFDYSLDSWNASINDCFELHFWK